jgi:hypothetical protein
MYVGRQTERHDEAYRGFATFRHENDKTTFKMAAHITEGQATSTQKYRGKTFARFYNIARRHASPDPI